MNNPFKPNLTQTRSFETFKPNSSRVDKLENLNTLRSIVMAKRKGNKQKRAIKDEFYMPTSEEEFQADLAADDARYLQYCREQEEMYNDPVMNWSGLR